MTFARKGEKCKGMQKPLNTEWTFTFSTGAAGFLEKSRRSFTDSLVGFCTNEGGGHVYTHLGQILTSIRNKIHPQQDHPHTPVRLHWIPGWALNL